MADDGDATSRTHSAPRSILLCSNLRQPVLDFLVLEDDVFQRCLSAQPGPTGVSALTSCVTSPPLPTCAQLGDVFTFAAAACIGIKLHSARYPDPAPFLRQDPRQPARSLTDLLTACRHSGQAPTSQRASSAHSPDRA